MSDFNEFLGNTLLARIALIIICLILVQFAIKLVIGIVIRGAVNDKRFRSKQAAKQREHTLIIVFTRTSAAMLWVVGIVMVLSQFEINLTGLAAGAGLIGIVVGLGAQKIAGDFFAGFFILLENQYGIGDIVEVKDMAYGVVERIDLRTTHIRNLDGGLHIIANSEIVNMANHSFGWATALVYLWVDYKTDIANLEKIMNKVGVDLSKDAIWGKELKAPLKFDRVEDYGADGLKVRAIGDTEPSMQWAVAGEYRRRLIIELDKANIKLADLRRFTNTTV